MYPGSAAGGLNLFSSYSHHVDGNSGSIGIGSDSAWLQNGSDTAAAAVSAPLQLPGFSNIGRSEQDILQLISAKQNSGTKQG